MEGQDEISATSMLVCLNGSVLNKQNYSQFDFVWLNVSSPVVADGSSSTDAVASLDLSVTWQGKKPTRLPESIWLEVRPLLSDSVRMHVDKLGTLIDTQDVVENGGSALHGLAPNGSVFWHEGAASGGSQALAVRSLDSP